MFAWLEILLEFCSIPTLNTYICIESVFLISKNRKHRVDRPNENYAPTLILTRNNSPNQLICEDFLTVLCNNIASFVLFSPSMLKYVSIRRNRAKYSILWSNYIKIYKHINNHGNNSAKKCMGRLSMVHKLIQFFIIRLWQLSWAHNKWQLRKRQTINRAQKLEYICVQTR